MGKKTDGITWNFNDALIIDDKMFFLALRKMYYVDLNSNKTFCVRNVKNYQWLESNWVAYIEAIQQTLFFFARENARIAKFNIESGNIEQIYEDVGKELSIYEFINNKDELWIFLKNDNKALIIKQNGTIEQLTYSARLDNNCVVSTKTKKSVYFFDKSNGNFWEFNVKTRRWLTGSTNMELSDCIAVNCYKDKFFFLLKEKIIVWDCKSGVKELALSGCEFKFPEFGCIYPMENKIIILPKCGQDIYEIDINGNIQLYDQYPSDYKYTRNSEWLKCGMKNYECSKKEGLLYFARRATNYIMAIDTIKEEIVWISTEMSMQVYLNSLKSKPILNIENDDYSINDFIEYIIY